MAEGSTQPKLSQELHQQVSQLFAEKLKIDVPAFDTDLVDEGLLDSLIFVDLIMQLEQTFEIEIPIRELEIAEFRSVVRIADLIARQQHDNKVEPPIGCTVQ